MGTARSGRARSRATGASGAKYKSPLKALFKDGSKWVKSTLEQLGFEAAAPIEEFTKRLAEVLPRDNRAI
mgnify:CR=1 FL=1